MNTTSASQPRTRRLPSLRSANPVPNRIAHRAIFSWPASAGWCCTSHPAKQSWASRDRRRWRRRGGCPTCCACHFVPGGKSESPSDGTVSRKTSHRAIFSWPASAGWCCTSHPAKQSWASRDRRRWRRRGGCPTCCACHFVPGGKSESPSDGTFAVPAARRRAGWPGYCGAVGLHGNGLQLAVKLADGLRNWTGPEFALQK
jgi:hypothetical protein